jgi:hypothetical protein
MLAAIASELSMVALVRTGARVPPGRPRRTRLGSRSRTPAETGAVLAANHGWLVFHRSAELAILVGGIVEEAA